MSGYTDNNGLFTLVLIHSALYTTGGKYHIQLNVGNLVIFDKYVRVPTQSSSTLEDLPVWV
jgi:hypothetical protein